MSKPAAFIELISCWVTAGLPQAVSLPGPIASNELPRFQPTPICWENSTAPIPPLVELEDELDDEDELDELELDEDELEEEELEEDELELEELLPLQLDTTPPSPHWSSQVFTPIQLWLFSHPQPLFWFWQSGRISPYQLQTSQLPPELDELELELLLELLVDELLLDEEELDEFELELLELEFPPVAVQLMMVAVGSSPFPWKPNSTELPG